MSDSPFTDHRHPPTPDSIRSALRSRLPLWERLTRFVEKSYQINGIWSTWGPAGTGWNLRYKRNGRSIVALHPHNEQVLAQVVLGKVQAERALKLDLGGKIRDMLLESPQLRDGRWLFVPITCEADAADVEKLLLAKIRPPRPGSGDRARAR